MHALFGATPEGEKNPGINYETKQFRMNTEDSSETYKWKLKKLPQEKG